MVTIYRAGSFRIVIFVNDHEPAHVHVIGEGEAKVNLTGSEGCPELIWAEGMKHSDLRWIMRIVSEHQDEFLIRWSAIHG